MTKENKIKLSNKTCSQCHNEFYTTLSNGDVFCPFCGYSFEIVKLGRRQNIRKFIVKQCIIANGFGQLNVDAVDISKEGIGIKMDGEFPFNKDETLEISVSQLCKDYSAQVAWVDNCNNGISRAGLELSKKLIL